MGSEKVYEVAEIEAMLVEITCCQDLTAIIRQLLAERRLLQNELSVADNALEAAEKRADDAVKIASEALREIPQSQDTQALRMRLNKKLESLQLEGGETRND